MQDIPRNLTERKVLILRSWQRGFYTLTHIYVCVCVSVFVYMYIYMYIQQSIICTYIYICKYVYASAMEAAAPTVFVV